ncbi:MAG: hypothetical protein AVDCRST_MAG59-3381, partial [uncultured Thermomicrobiales bacterium]
ETELESGNCPRAPTGDPVPGRRLGGCPRRGARMHLRQQRHRRRLLPARRQQRLRRPPLRARPGPRRRRRCRHRRRGGDRGPGKPIPVRLQPRLPGAGDRAGDGRRAASRVLPAWWRADGDAGGTGRAGRAIPRVGRLSRRVGDDPARRRHVVPPARGDRRGGDASGGAGNGSGGARNAGCLVVGGVGGRGWCRTAALRRPLPGGGDALPGRRAVRGRASLPRQRAPGRQGHLRVPAHRARPLPCRRQRG